MYGKWKICENQTKTMLSNNNKGIALEAIKTECTIYSRLSKPTHFY